jgi:hypothetical protein
MIGDPEPKINFVHAVDAQQQDVLNLDGLASSPTTWAPRSR